MVASRLAVKPTWPRGFAWQEMGRPDSAALTVSTRCENRLCVRHLRTRTRSAIMASVPRGKGWLSVEQSHFARTTARQSSNFANSTQKGGLTQAMVAERFGLSLSNVKSILGRLSWKHIEPMSDLNVYEFLKHLRSGIQPGEFRSIRKFFLMTRMPRLLDFSNILFPCD
jgi:hypothetical protein